MNGWQVGIYNRYQHISTMYLTYANSPSKSCVLTVLLMLNCNVYFQRMALDLNHTHWEAQLQHSCLHQSERDSLAHSLCLNLEHMSSLHYSITTGTYTSSYTTEHIQPSLQFFFLSLLLFFFFLASITYARDLC